MLHALLLALAPVDDPAPTAAELLGHVRFLASDALAGRSTGSLEAMLAARYLAEELARAGWQPAGDGGFLQHVPMARTEYTGAPSVVLIDADGARRELVHGVDYEVDGGVAERASFALVRVAEDGELPAGESAEALFLDGSSGAARRRLDSGGAGFGLVLTVRSRRAGSAPREGAPRERSRIEARPSLGLRGDVCVDLAAGAFTRIEIDIPGRALELPAANVVARLPGVGTPERPELAREVVVLSAHYDHIGTRDGVAEGEDAIFNGADDDASGCAAVLEIAEALAAAGPPARTLIVLLATGEEIGLVGTRHYLENPAEPLDCTVCNLNFEMVGRPDALLGEPGQVWLTGDERSNLGAALRAAGLAVVPDPRPAQNYFQRSDNYAFARLGIVAQTLSTFGGHTDYHRVSDEVELIDGAHMQAVVGSGLAAARLLAAGSLDPTWNPGGNPAE